MPRLRTLAQLDLDHLDLRACGLFGKTLWVEKSGFRPTTEIPAADFPDKIAAVLAVVGTYSAFAGVVGEPAQLCTLVQGSNGIGAQRTEAHGRDIENRRHIG